jgi:HPt (histidine-containing phosphotransfer) domain-containing protein
MGDSESDFEIRLNELRQKYLDRCRSRVETAKQWAERASADSRAVKSLHAMAHEMAGSGATYGFPGITMAADGIEALLEPLARRDEVLRTDETAEELNQMIRELQEAIPDEV